MAFVNSSGFMLSVPLIVGDNMRINAMVVRGGPWQPPPLMGMRGYRLALPDDPVMVLVQEIPLSTSLHSVPMAKNDLEQLHINKFCTDHQLATGARPYREVRPGPNPPDFLGMVGSQGVRIDCTQFGLQARRLAQSQFANVRQVVLASDPSRFAHLAGLAIYVWVLGQNELELPMKPPAADALLAALEAYRFDPSKGRASGNKMPDVHPPIDIVEAGGWRFVGNPITFAMPHSPFFIRMGFELGFVFNSEHSLAEEWAEFARLVAKHDKGDIDELVVTFGAPDHLAMLYPSEEAVLDLMLERIPEVRCDHLRRVFVYGWGTGRILQVAPNVHEIASGVSTGVVPTHQPLVKST